MAVNFSHYAIITAAMIARLCERGKTPTDETLLEAFERISPPLLPSAATERVIAKVKGKRGRPGKGTPSIEEIVTTLGRIERDDVPPAYLQALASRLKTARGFLEKTRAIQSHKKIESSRRNTLICFLYRDLYNRLPDFADGVVEHPVLGPIAIPEDASTRRSKAITMTGKVLRDRTDYSVVDERRLLNIISENSARIS